MSGIRFADFLERPGWCARSGEETLDAERASALVGRACSELGAGLRGRGADSLTVFCVWTQLEALLAYFVASRMGLLAAVVLPPSWSHFENAFRPAGGLSWVLPRGRKPPEGVGPKDVVVSLSYLGQPATADASQEAVPPASAPARFVFCTSGSTGVPKRVLCEELRLVANAEVVANYLGLRASDRTLCAFPVTLMYGLSTTLCALLSGGTVEYATDTRSAVLARRVAAEEFTVFPTLGDWAGTLARLWSARGFAPDRLVLLNASDRLLVSQAEQMRPFASAYWNNLGQTESGPRLFALELCGIASLEDVAHDGVIAPGRPVHPDIELSFPHGCDDNGFGLLSYRTPFAMLGYLGNDGAVSPAPDWIESGDLFRRSPDGLWLWAGRAHQAVKINGRYFSLRQLEVGLLRFEEVAGVACAKDADGKLLLFVQAPASDDLARRIDEHVRPLVRGKNVALRLVPDFPRTESGKIDARRLIDTTSGCKPTPTTVSSSVS